MKIKEIYKSLFLINFKTQKELAHTFLRFQEHYESQNPKFTKGGFTRSEFEVFYRKQMGKFTYYTDWGGFNVPGTILQSFYDGKFKNLTKNEKRILSIFKEKNLNEIYIIGTYGKENGKTLQHEIAHGFFFLDKEYRQEVQETIRIWRSRLNNLIKWLTKIGYNKSVLIDEAHAYLLSDIKFETEENKGLVLLLKSLFKEAQKRNKK